MYFFSRTNQSITWKCWTSFQPFHIDGRFLHPQGDVKSEDEGVFLALCTPIDTSIDPSMYHAPIAEFTTKHTLDMRIIDSCKRQVLINLFLLHYKHFKGKIQPQLKIALKESRMVKSNEIGQTIRKLWIL